MTTYSTPQRRSPSPLAHDVVACGIAGIGLTYALERRLADQERVRIARELAAIGTSSRVRGWFGTRMMQLGGSIAGARSSELTSVPSAPARIRAG